MDGCDQLQYLYEILLMEVRFGDHGYSDIVSL